MPSEKNCAALRLKKKMGLVELGRHTGLSAAMLSKVERGKLFPTLPTLLRIALVFSVGLEYFFSDDQKRHVVGIVRRAQRKRFPERPDGRDISFYFEPLDFASVDRKLNAYHAEFQPLPPGKARTHHHAGVEFLTVLRGKLELHIGNEAHVLEIGRLDLFRFLVAALVQANQPETLRCDCGYRAVSGRTPDRSQSQKEQKIRLTGDP